jgi:hypothetical protein
MKKLLVIFLILILTVSCGLIQNNNISHHCDYKTHIETINDTVYVTSTHTHTLHTCSPDSRPLNNDWIIMH